MNNSFAPYSLFAPISQALHLRKFLKNSGVLLCNLSLILNSFLPYFAAVPAYADEPEPTQIVESTSTPIADPTITETPVVEPTAEPTAIPTTEPTIEPTVVPTEEPTITPEATATPEITITPSENNNQSSDNNNSSFSSPEPTTSVASPTNVPTSVPTTIPIVGNIDTTVVENNSCRTDILNPIIGTDKADYHPTEIAIISGHNFLPNIEYKLKVTSDNLDQTYDITSDSTGNFTYSYQLDGNYRPNYKVEAKDTAGKILATTTFTDPPVTCGNGTVEAGEQCDDGNTQNGDGCSSTCQTEDPTTGTINIVKQTAGGDDTFSFSSDTSLGNFNITTSGTTGVKQFSHLTPGTQRLYEVVPTNWQLTNISCNDPDNGTVIDSTGLRSVWIDVDAGETITCTFTNTRLAYCGDGIVNGNEQCDGGTCCDAATCTFKSAQTECRGTNGNICDIAEMCTGSNANCPSDTFASFQTPCSDGLYCNGAEVCDGLGHPTAGTPISCPSKPNTTSLCSENSQSCSYSCQQHYNDCDGNMSNGCEVNSQTDNSNCGVCGNACNADRQCISGSCQISDSTPPIISKVVTGTSGANGWYTSDVTVTWTVTDAESTAVIDSGCGTQTFTSETVSADSSCSAHSLGGSSSDSVNLKLDKTGPETAYLLVTAGTLGSNGWYKSNVNVATICNDSISPLLVRSSDENLTTDTTGQVFNGYCTNWAGLTTNTAHLTVKLDKTAPSVGTITITPSFIINGNLVITALSTISAPVSDTGSGIDPTSCRYAIDGGHGASITVADAYDSVSGKCIFKDIDTTLASGIAISVNDNAGNYFNTTNSWVPVTVDATAPLITNITSETPDGIYGIGITIPVTVQFNETVNVINPDPSCHIWTPWSGCIDWYYYYP